MSWQWLAAGGVLSHHPVLVLQKPSNYKSKVSQAFFRRDVQTERNNHVKKHVCLKHLATNIQKLMCLETLAFPSSFQEQQASSWAWRERERERKGLHQDHAVSLKDSSLCTR